MTRSVHMARLAFVWFLLAVDAAGTMAVGGASAGTLAPVRGGRLELVHELTLPNGVAPDLWLSAAVCSHSVFLLSSSRTNSIIRIDRHGGHLVVHPLGHHLPPHAMVMAMAADCDRHCLYVVATLPSSGVVLALSTNTGAVQQVLRLPPWSGAGFVPDYRARVSADGRRLAINGFWPKPDLREFLSKPADTAFQGIALAALVDLRTGQARPLFREPLRTCLAPLQNCGRVPLERDGDGWVLADLEKPSLHFADAAGNQLQEQALLGTTFVRSVAAPFPEASANDRWAEAHSAITHVCAFKAHFAVAHSRPRSIDRVNMPQFDSRLSIVDRSGRAVVDDVSLPDLPVGCDGSGVYVVDYGPAGRRADARTFRLLRFDVDAAVSGRGRVP